MSRYEQRRLEEARQEAVRWKRIALFLADCHAATTAYDRSLASVSASRKARLVSICAKTIALMTGNDRGDDRYDSSDEERRVLDRVRRSIEDA